MIDPGALCAVGAVLIFIGVLIIIIAVILVSVSGAKGNRNIKTPQHYATQKGEFEWT